ncbi:MAG: AMP-binding protein, partial [bacterium]|nr:AMP-binding protein [bacterium]
YPMLATGGAVVFYSHPLAQAAAEVLEYARVHRLTKINLPPAYWHQVVDEVAAREATVPATLRILTTGGESPSPEKLRLWAAHARPGQRYFNVYGPTEGTILVTAEPVPLPSGARAAGPRIPIGRPLPEVAIYLADARGRAVGIGVPGELLIGGVGVARGYLGQPRLTADRFVPDPLSGDPFAGPEAAGSRLYRTGDLARTRADGRIEYLGRTDRQVKVRGFRIEPEEIEVVLRRHPAVEAAAVVVREDPPGERRLAAYVVPRTLAAEVAELRGFLQQQLPVYMVPAVFVALDALPLAATGKVDLRALPDPGAESGSATRRYLAPRTPEEEILAGIWAEVLGVERVGVDDDFFVLGGDSILSIQIVARARRAGLELTPQQLFQHHTIAELAAGAATGLVAVAEQGPVTGAVALTPIQRWFFEHPLPRPEHWNQSLLLGVGHRLDPAALAAALERLLAHHDALRLRFRREAGGWRQEIGPPAPPPPLTAVDLTAVASPHRSAAITAAAARTQTSLDLGRGPLLRAVCFDLGDPPARLLLVIHHLAVDAVSWRLLLEDLETAYDALSRGREPVLPAKTTSYKAWAERLEGHATSEETAAELDGWLAAAGAVAPLPVDGERRTNLEASAAAVTVELSPEETRSLLKEVPNAYRTRINDVLLAALARALAWWTGREEVVIDLEGHGREELDEDVDLARTVGWFTAIYPLRLDLSAAAGPGELLKTVKEQLRAVPRHGIGHGLLRYLRRGEELAALPQPEVSFNYLGRVDQGVAGSSRWLAVPEASGPDRGPGGPRTHLLAIDGAVTGGRLRMSWSYGTGVHDRATVEAVAGDFLTTLRELIDHCLSPEAGGYTPSDFPLARIDQALLDRLAAAGPIEDLYPLSPMQQGMLFHSLSDPDSGVYLERTTCELVGELDRTALRRAWQHLVDHHPVLRTAFVWEGTSEPLQVVRPRRELDWRELDWRGVEPAAEEERFAGLLAGERRAGLDLARPPLLRVILVELAADRFRLLWLHHHALLDGWSLPLLTADLFRCYEAFCSGAEPELERRRPYRDYIAWLRSQSPEAAAAHWRETLRGFRAPTPVTGDRPSGPTAADGDPGAVCDRRLGAGVSDDLEALARRERITLSTLVQGLWAVLLSRTSGGYRDVVFGLTTSGRPPELAGVESTLGLYINTVPVRARLERDQPPFPWLRRLQDQVAASRQYEYLPLTQVRAWSEVPGGVELFESLFVFENYPVGEALDRRSAALQVRGFRALERTNYPLTLLVSPGPRLGLRLIYQTARCDGTTAQRLLAHFATLLGG